MTAKKVLIVDDDRDFAETITDVLTLQGHEVEVAHSGEEAVARFRERDYDIAFMDVKLPGRNGVESFLEIRKLKPRARVVMMTGFSVEQLLDQALAKGAWAILHKPLDMRRVLQLIEDARGNGVILIADDDADFAQTIADILKIHGYGVVIAGNGREALEIIRRNGINLLILDLRMPIVDGLGVYLELRKEGLLLPTIIVTAYPNEEKDTIDLLSSFSATGILCKPIDPGNLLRCVSHTLSHQP